MPVVLPGLEPPRGFFAGNLRSNLSLDVLLENFFPRKRANLAQATALVRNILSDAVAIEAARSEQDGGSYRRKYSKSQACHRVRPLGVRNEDDDRVEQTGR